MPRGIFRTIALRSGSRQKTGWQRLWLGIAKSGRWAGHDLVIANSKKAKSEIVSLIGIPQERVRVIYLGTDPSSTYFSLEARLRARAWLGKSDHRPIVAFVGAMGYDNNKGFDTLCAAWKGLCAQEWDADLIVAGGGRAVGLWKQRIEHLGLARRITLLGFTDSSERSSRRI